MTWKQVASINITIMAAALVVTEHLVLEGLIVLLLWGGALCLAGAERRPPKPERQDPP